MSTRWIPIPIRAKSTRRHGNQAEGRARLPLEATKKGESMENRGWIRPRAESSSRSGTPAPARGALAAAAAAGRQEREDESLLPATRSIVSSPSSSSSFASSGGGARLQSNVGLGFAPGRTTHGGRERLVETREAEKKYWCGGLRWPNISSPVAYVGLWLYFIGPKAFG
jgi:hypothetical protein